MVGLTRPPLLEELQLEFPSLDSSLIAAFLSERDSESLTRRQRRTLHRILTKLATGADHDEQLISEALSGTHIDGSSLSSSALDRDHETSSAPSIVTDATSLLASPRSTVSSIASFSSPFGFLQAAFPGVPSTRLERVIEDASCVGGPADDVDVERAVQLLLTEEYPPDSREVGGMQGALDTISPAHGTKPPIANAKGKKRKNKSKTSAINDIRQRDNHPNTSGSRHGSRSTIPSRFSDLDIWTSISSISAQLAALLPPHSESFFKSFFHGPESKTPATAIRLALTTITTARDSEVLPLDVTVLLNLQDILRSTPEYDELSGEQRKRLFSDAHLCLRAVASRADSALDLIELLRDLDTADAAGWKMAPYHQEPLPRQNHSLIATPEDTPFPTSAVQVELQLGRLSSQHQDEWNVVSSRRRPTTSIHHGISILASNDSRRTSTNQIGIAADTNPLRLKERADDIETRARQAYVSAARAWKGSNPKNLGGQVAMYHVEKARRLREEYKDAALEYQRARVNATKKTTSSGTTVDLHYTTTSQAVILAKECLRDHGASDTRPLEFITGRGNHSIGGKAVLRPVVYDALIEDGWNALTLPAGVIVYGRLPD